MNKGIKIFLIVFFTVLVLALALGLGLGLGIGLDEGPLKIVPLNDKSSCITKPISEFNSEVIKYIKDMSIKYIKDNFASNSGYQINVSPIDNGSGRIESVVLEVPGTILISDTLFLKIAEGINKIMKSKKYVLILIFKTDKNWNPDNNYKIELYLGNSDISDIQYNMVYEESNKRISIKYSGYSKPLDKYIKNCVET